MKLIPTTLNLKNINMKYMYAAASNSSGEGGNER